MIEGSGFGSGAQAEIVGTGKSHGDLCPWSIPTPDRIRQVLLEHHVVADNGGHFQLRICDATDAREQ